MDTKNRIENYIKIKKNIENDNSYKMLEEIYMQVIKEKIKGNSSKK